MSTGSITAREMFDADQASQALGIEISELAPGSATVTVTVGETMVNGHGITHGGYVFLLADTAFALACNGYEDSAVAARGHPISTSDPSGRHLDRDRHREGARGPKRDLRRDRSQWRCRRRRVPRRQPIHHPLKFSPRCFSSRREVRGGRNRRQRSSPAYLAVPHGN